MPSPVLTDTIEKHYHGARDPQLARARAERAAELGYRAFVHYHPYGTGHHVECHKRVTVEPLR